MQKPELQRAQIYREIGSAFDKLDKAGYPNIYKLIQYDDKRVTIMDQLVSEMYGDIHNASLEEALSTIETSISSES